MCSRTTRHRQQSKVTPCVVPPSPPTPSAVSPEGVSWQHDGSAGSREEARRDRAAGAGTVLPGGGGELLSCACQLRRVYLCACLDTQGRGSVFSGGPLVFFALKHGFDLASSPPPPPSSRPSAQLIVFSFGLISVCLLSWGVSGACALRLRC